MLISLAYIFLVGLSFAAICEKIKLRVHRFLNILREFTISHGINPPSICPIYPTA